jgi:hypothetical protein
MAIARTITTPPGATALAEVAAGLAGAGLDALAEATARHGPGGCGPGRA